LAKLALGELGTFEVVVDVSSDPALLLVAEDFLLGEKYPVILLGEELVAEEVSATVFSSMVLQAAKSMGLAQLVLAV
jgi:hypothetical protein